MELQKDTAPDLDEKNFCLKNQIFCRVLPLHVYDLGLIWGLCVRIWGLYVCMILPLDNAISLMIVERWPVNLWPLISYAEKRLMMIEISLFTLSVCKVEAFVSYDVEVLMQTASVVTLTMIITQHLYNFTFSLFFF